VLAKIGFARRQAKIYATISILRKVQHICICALVVYAVLPMSMAQASLIRVIVVDFDSSVRANYTQRLPELIVDELVNSGSFDVLEREKLTSLANELAFQGGALVNPDKAVEIGSLSGAQLMITGNILGNTSSRKSSTSYNIKSTISTYYLKARMEIIDLQTGSKIFSNIAEDTAVLKSTGPNVVGRGEGSLGPRVAGKLVNAMLENTRIQRIIDAAGQGDAAPISIRVNSVPEGADVEIDGVYLGNAGNNFEVSAGIHDITVSLPGYTVWSKKVKVKEGLSFTANLSKSIDGS